MEDIEKRLEGINKMIKEIIKQMKKDIENKNYDKLKNLLLGLILSDYRNEYHFAIFLEPSVLKKLTEEYECLKEYL